MLTTILRLAYAATLVTSLAFVLDLAPVWAPAPAWGALGVAWGLLKIKNRIQR